MGTYLEDYLESMYLLPSEIKRNFDLMRELDKTSYPLIEELRSSHREFLRSAREKVVARCADGSQEEPTEQELRELVDTDEHLDKLRETHTRVVQKLDEKIAIAAQSYDIVDHHIRRLDQDLEAYASLLRATGEFEEDKSHKKRHKASHQGQPGLAGAPQPQLAAASAAGAVAQHTPQSRNKASTLAKGGSAAGSGSASSSAAAGGLSATGARDRSGSSTIGTSSSSAVASSSGSSSSRKRSAAAAALDAAALAAPALAVDDMPIDPNEPIYCSCRRVSFGQMVGCDNDDCKFEWFHFGCVGLSDQPQGKWYCPDCRVVLGIK